MARRESVYTTPIARPRLMPSLPEEGGDEPATSSSRQRMRPSIDPLSARGAGVRSNLLRRRQSAQLAGAMPRPQPIALNDVRGNPTGRFDHSGGAARAVFVDRNNAEADLLADAAGMGSNYFQGRDLAADANRRSNDLNVADVGLIGSAAGLNDANAGLVDAQALRTDEETRTLLPAQAGLTRSQGRHLDAQTSTEHAMRGVKVGQGEMEIAKGRRLLPSLGAMADAQAEAARVGVQERRALLPGLVGRQQAETGALTAQADASRATLDPTASIAADKAAFELAQQMAEGDYQGQSNWRWALDWLPGVEDIKSRGELAQAHFQKLRPSLSPKGESSSSRTVVRRGKEKGTGRTVIQYSDGTRAYAS